MARKGRSNTPIYFAGAAVGGGLIGFRFFSPAAGWGAAQFLVTALILALTAMKLFRLAAHEQPGRRHGLEAGLLLLVCVQVAVQGTGGLTSPFVPAMFLLLAMLSAYTDGVSAAVFVATSVCLQLSAELGQSTLAAFGQWGGALGVYALTCAAFALVVGTFVRVERRRRLQAAAALRRFDSDAESLSAEMEFSDDEENTPLLQEEQERRLRRATRLLDDSLYNVLTTARHALGAHSVIYFRHDAADRLHIRQMATDSNHIIEGDLDARTGGLLAGVVKTGAPVTLTDTRDRALPYYTRREPVRCATAVPVRHDEVLRGVLVADHSEAGRFGDAETNLLAGYGRTLAEMEQHAREREQQAQRAHRLAHYFETSKRLTATLALDEVLTVAISACEGLARFDFAAIVEADEESRRLTVRKAAGEYEGRLMDKNATVEGSLVGWVIKNKQYLPLPHFRKRDMRTPLFGKRVDPDGIRSALIFPLAREGNAVGAFVVGSLTRDAFDADEVQLLEGIANQTALAMANAILYRRTQEMATTDGLTKLPNHRTFQETLTKELDRAQRSQAQLSLILLDVDHFKNVNDSHGHPVGDQVLRQVAEVLRKVVQRTVDLPARYGGEEFVIVLPDTDAKGARRVADKIRAAIARIPFEGARNATFHVTMSAGISVYPSDGAAKQTLIDRADKALYQSKRNGRNQTTLWRDLPDELRAAPPVVGVSLVEARK